MRLSYYPGCSLEATGKEYDQSSRAVCTALGIHLAEIDDWNCCGATSAHSINSTLALALPARNLLIAERAGFDVVTPCAACYNRLKRAEHALRHGQDPDRLVGSAFGDFQGKITVLSLLEVVVKRVGFDEIAAHVRRPLNGLKVVSYYGCLLVRPPEITGFDSAENPVLLDQLMTELGAEVKSWSCKTDCCGASSALASPQVAAGMAGRLLEMAAEAGADALVTACPLCQTNLELHRPPGTPRIPSFYFTELLGLAFGLPGVSLWLRRHLVNPFPLLQELTLAY
ncbi:MAG: CoB--CoM heterodisulfide reductase iron-sulfur subunit B family protein [Peptococcaceae bacterium]|nr:CoB--CoM heterodisulfide reductase iron-sulfur subunit B family protein [Peptococcaceae bacterium]